MSATEFQPIDRLLVVGNGVNGGARSDALVILKNGNTGVGVSIPTQRLHVAGSIRMVDGNEVAGRVMVSAADGTGSWADVSTTASGTLDQAYDFGGAGVGRTIVADAGAVRIIGTDGLQVSGTYGSGAVLDLAGAGTRMFFNPRKAAFRAGLVEGTQWDDANVGLLSTAWGFNNRASGFSSTAWGSETNATVNYTTAWGENTIASATSATAWGVANTASGVRSTVWGNTTTASGINASAFGFSTTAAGSNATAWGENTIASATAATAWGVANTASGVRSTAWGNTTTASGINASAFGFSTTAAGNNATAFGIGNSAPSLGETALGVWSTPYTALSATAINVNDRVFVVGNGTSNLVRNDALVILKNGNTGVGVSIPTQRLHVAGSIRMVDGNQAANRVLVSAADGTASWQDLAPVQTNAWGLTGNAILATNFIGSTNNQPVIFRANNTEHMRIQATGNVGIGNVAPTQRLHVVGSIRMVDGNQAAGRVMTSAADGTASWQVLPAATATAWGLNGNAILATNFIGSTNNQPLIFRTNNVERMRITPTGLVGIGIAAPAFDLTLANNSAAKPGSNVWTIASDARLKRDVSAYTDGLALIRSIDPIWYTYTGEAGMPQERFAGAMAQDIQRVAPYMVRDWTYTDEQGQSKDYLAVDYGALDFAIINAIKEQQAMIEELQAQLARMNAELERLRNER